MSHEYRIAALIPAFNPGPVVKEVVEKALHHVEHIILVNDGCDEKNSLLLTQLAQSNPQISLVLHPINLGKGFAIKSGLSHALKTPVDYVIMLDSDGQHDPDELLLFIERIKTKQPAFIMGVRTQINQMPLKSKLGNVSMSLAFRLLTGKRLVDTQSGYRALSKSFIELFLTQCKAGRYETEMNMLMLASKQQQEIEQVEISTIYIDDNKNSKFRPFQDSIRVLSSYLLFAGVGLLSFLIDYGLFIVLTQITGSYFIHAHLFARVGSSVFNYFATKKYVFNNQGAAVSTGIKYLMAVLVSLLLSTSILYLFVDFFGWNPILAKPLAEFITFSINFFVLRHFVFQRLTDD